MTDNQTLELIAWTATAVGLGYVIGNIENYRWEKANLIGLKAQNKDAGAGLGRRTGHRHPGVVHISVACTCGPASDRPERVCAG